MILYSAVFVRTSFVKHFFFFLLVDSSKEGFPGSCFKLFDFTTSTPERWPPNCPTPLQQPRFCISFPLVLLSFFQVGPPGSVDYPFLFSFFPPYENTVLSPLKFHPSPANLFATSNWGVISFVYLGFVSDLDMVRPTWRVFFLSQFRALKSPFSPPLLA